MSAIHDHDRINVLSAEVAGLHVLVREVVKALETLDHPDAKRATERARMVLAATEEKVTQMQVLGEQRWAESSESERRPDRLS